MLADVQRRRVALDSGLEIALLDWGGSGPPALLHHANGFCAATWALVAAGLRRHFRVVAMDARGHGDSSKPADAASYRWEHFARDAGEVAAILAAEHADGRIALGLGHSFGGTALLAASAERPGLFDRLVLVDPIVMPAPSSGAGAVRRSRGGSLAEGARKRRHIWPDRGTARARWVDKEMFAGWDPRVLDLYLAEGMRDRADGRVELKCSGEVEASIFERGAHSDVGALALRVLAPTLILWAARGDFPRRHFEDLASRMPDAQVRDADAGHLVPMQRPDLVVDAALAAGKIDVAG
ncbi:MAG: alpha/beta hydrolase [Myxococcales bacterium]|nr:alpha/beta hydrolase [Myxococcales bacterium]